MVSSCFAVFVALSFTKTQEGVVKSTDLFGNSKMVRNLDYKVISTVMSSWEATKHVPGFEETMSDLIFTK